MIKMRLGNLKSRIINQKLIGFSYSVDKSDQVTQGDKRSWGQDENEHSVVFIVESHVEELATTQNLTDRT